jgi:F-type H+-transporting ATPase subunit b
MTTTIWVLLAGTGHNPPPLIDIDSTVFVQLGIFLFLLVVLTFAVFRPYLALRAERSRSIEGVREEALKLSKSNEEKLQRYEEQIAKTRKEAAAVRVQIRQEGEARATEVIGEAQKRAQSELGAARQKLEKSTQAAELALRTRADVLAKAVASKLLGREV